MVVNLKYKDNGRIWELLNSLLANVHARYLLYSEQRMRIDTLLYIEIVSKTILL